MGDMQYNIIQSAKVHEAIEANKPVLAAESAAVKAARLDLAARNLRSVKGCHRMIVAQTIVGILDLSFSDGTYTLTKGTIEGVITFAEGPAKDVKPVLATFFTVEN